MGCLFLLPLLTISIFIPSLLSLVTFTDDLEVLQTGKTLRVKDRRRRSLRRSKKADLEQEHNIIEEDINVVRIIMPSNSTELNSTYVGTGVDITIHHHNSVRNEVNATVIHSKRKTMGKTNETSIANIAGQMDLSSSNYSKIINKSTMINNITESNEDILDTNRKKVLKKEDQEHFFNYTRVALGTKSIVNGTRVKSNRTNTIPNAHALVNHTKTPLHELKESTRKEVKLVFNITKVLSNDEATDMVHFKSKTEDFNKTINSIALVGERHSGTKYILDELRKCFPRIFVTDYLSRFKHWFQDEDLLSSFLKELSNEEGGGIMVLAQFRDPYSWVEANIRYPYHSPTHQIHLNSGNGWNPLPWKQFLKTPWSMARPLRDLLIEDEKNVICQENYKYSEVIPCLSENHNHKYPCKVNTCSSVPIYELKRGGKAFESILELRSEKIKNFMNISNWDSVEHLLSVRYEDLIRLGTRPMMEHIARITGHRPACNYLSPEPKRLLNKHIVDQGFIRYLDKHVDWSVEQMVGYVKYKN